MLHILENVCAGFDQQSKCKQLCILKKILPVEDLCQNPKQNASM